MFYDIRFQTGELDDVIASTDKGSVPCMDVLDGEELNWVIDELAKKGLYKIEYMPYDKNARDKLKEPNFEYRVAFSRHRTTAGKIPQDEIKYVDFYFEPDLDETYDSIGEL
ncbi:MAG TPA: hypothetical protein VF941_15800 [Clostridia bacterium]